MLKAYKYRIFPNQEQATKLVQAMGCVRYIFNKALETKMEAYEKTGKTLTYFDLNGAWLHDEKKEHEWLRECYSQSLQEALRNNDNAFTKFFKKNAKFPKFKKKHDNRQSVSYTQKVKVNWETNQVWIPKCGKVKIILSRQFEGKIKTCTVSKTPTDKFFISILVDNDVPLPTKQPGNPDTTVGIDLGIKTFATLSNGGKIDNPKHLAGSLAKLKRLQRRHSRKQKGSKNKNRARLKVAKAYETITNQRKDFLHKTSTQIVRENQTIILEDLNIAGMLKNHTLARSISDCGWGTFVEFLKYKAEWQGKNIIQIGMFEASSKTCSCCGHIKSDLTLSDRIWTCSECHTVHDRDVNAAINIKKFGLIKLARSGSERPAEPTPKGRPTHKRGSEMPGSKQDRRSRKPRKRQFKSRLD